MTDEERRAWIRTLVILAVVATARWGWTHRAAGEGVPGAARDVAAAADTVRELRSEEERRTRPLGPGETLDPNRADPIDLDRLPGVGPATAEAIVSARDEQAFRTVDDLLRVRGIGPSTLAKIAPHLRVTSLPASRAAPRTAPGTASASTRPAAPASASETPVVDLNRAGPLELESLPGIGPALAGRIIRDRGEAGPYRTVDDLLRVSGIGPVVLERIRPRVRVR